ncbi:MAG TPA: hypothetical protein VHZ76_08475 [Gammaproteobacteria bacterium]|nr:hypothetical protein [Gammaproteobacteria bacterium]
MNGIAIKQQPAIKRIFIFDPCFGALTGHWENYCKRLYHELVERGFQVKVFGQVHPNNKIIEGINFEPVFTYSPYVFMPNMHAFNQQASLFLNNFNAINTAEFQDGDIFIFHSIFPQTFSAILEWTKELSLQKKIITALFFQFPPANAKKHENVVSKLFCWLQKKLSHNQHYHSNMVWVENNNVRFYQQSSIEVSRLVDAGSHILLASTDVLSQNFSALFRKKVHYLPMPGEKLPNPPIINMVDISKKNALSPIDHNFFPSIKIGYFGHSALEKGGQFLRYIVERTLILYPNAEFVLHINPNPDTEIHLERFKIHKLPNVSCHFGHLEQTTIMSLMAQVDILLMPYSPHKYATTPSAVFTEGMPLQKIFVLPKGTWMSEEAKKYNAGYTTFSAYHQDSILRALMSAIIHFKTLKQKSIMAGIKFYQENNMTNYIDVLMDVL